MSNSDYQTQYISSQQVQPIQLYYNFVLPSIPQQPYPQPMLIQPNPMSHCYVNQTQLQPVLSMPLQGMPQNQFQKQQQQIQQVQFQQQQQQQKQQQQQQFQYFSSFDTFKQKIILVSEIFQVTQEEAIEILSDNTCICCRNQLNENILDQTTIKETASTKQIPYEQSQSKYQKQYSQQEFQSIQSNQNQTETNENKERAHIIQNNHINANCVHINNILNNRDKNNFNQNEQTLNSISSQRDFLQQSTEITFLTKQKNKNFDSKQHNPIFEKRRQINLDKNCELSNNQMIMDQQDINFDKVTNQQNQIKKNKDYKTVKSQTNETNDEIYFDQKQISSGDHSDFDQENNKKSASYQIIRKGIQKQNKNITQNKKYLISENTQQSNKLDKQKKNSEIFEIHNIQSVQSTNKASIVFPSLQKQEQNKNINEINQNTHNQQQINSEEQTDLKKEFQNDSNYTKNLLKGFRRVMIKNYGKDVEFIDNFKSYFDTFALNNEFILKLFSDSQYAVYFEEFLETDPQWWMKEARIKDTENQIEFFEICKRREFSSIRTKRKNFVRPNLV